MTTMTIGEIIAVASLLLNAGIALVGSTWGISWAMGKIRSTVADEISRHRTDIDIKFDQVERNVGENIAALRTALHQTQLWTRDNLEPKGEAERTLARYERMLAGALTDITRRLDRMEGKIDKQSRGSPHCPD